MEIKKALFNYDNKNWLTESRTIYKALYKIKWKQIWQPKIIDTTSTQWFRYRLKLHRLPLCYKGTNGLCTALNCSTKKETHTYYQWECSEHISRFFNFLWRSIINSDTSLYLIHVMTGLMPFTFRSIPKHFNRTNYLPDIQTNIQFPSIWNPETGMALLK